MVRPSLFRPWPCENSERAFTEGNRVLPAAVFRTVLPFPARTLEAGEGNRSTCAARSNVFTRPRPKAVLDDLLAVAAQHWMSDYRRTPQKRAVPIRSDYEEHLI